MNHTSKPIDTYLICSESFVKSAFRKLTTNNLCKAVGILQTMVIIGQRCTVTASDGRDCTHTKLQKIYCILGSADRSEIFYTQAWKCTFDIVKHINIIGFTKFL